MWNHLASERVLLVWNVRSVQRACCPFTLTSFANEAFKAFPRYWHQAPGHRRKHSGTHPRPSEDRSRSQWHVERAWHRGSWKIPGSRKARRYSVQHPRNGISPPSTCMVWWEGDCDRVKQGIDRIKRSSYQVEARQLYSVLLELYNAITENFTIVT